MHISTVLPSQRSEHAQKAYLLKGQAFLVDCDGPVIYARPISESDLAPEPNRSLRLDAGITAMTLYTVRNKTGSFSPGIPADQKTQGIVALSNDTLHFIELSSAGLRVRLKLPLAIVQGHARPPEGGTCVQVASIGSTELLVLHATSGFLTVVDLGGLFSPKRQNVPHRTFSIGSIAVVRLAILPSSSSQPVIAVLYRDIDFNYSLRYYTVDSHISALPVLCQMELFSGTPSHVMPAAGGCFVFSDLKMWYFPASGARVSLADSASADATLSLSQKHNVVTKSVSGHTMGVKVTCATQIDPCRYLYVTDTGSTHMVYMRTEGNRAQVQVADFQVLDLGKSTIASSLVHVSDNVFYAGSNISRSIMFQVRTSHPYIHVAKTMTNSPPILDVCMGSDAYSQEMWISRGGFHNGEVQLYAGSSFGMVHKAVAAVAASATDVCFSAEDEIVVYENGQATRTFTLEQCGDSQIEFVDSQIELVDSQVGVVDSQVDVADSHAAPAHNGPLPHISRLFGISDVRKWRIGSKDLILNNGTFIYRGISRDTHMTQITDMECYMQDDILHIVVASWGGQLCHVDFGSQSTVETVETGATGHTSVCRTKDMVFSIDGCGNIYESHGFGGESRRFGANSPETGFKLVGDGEDHVLVYSTNSVYVVGGTGFSHPKRVYRSRRRIKSCDVQGSKVAVLFQDQSVSIFELEPLSPNQNAFLSDKLILKTVVVENWVVVLQMETAANSHTRTPQRNMTLLVLDSRTLQVVSQEAVGGGLVDICLVYTSGFPLLVGAYTSYKAPEDILAVFRVEKGRLRKLHVPIHGLLPKTATLAKIKAYANHVYVAGSTALQFTLQCDGFDPKISSDMTDFSWTGQVIESNSEPFFFVDLACSAQGLVLADANRGLFFREKDGPVQKLSLDHEPFYPTAMAILEDSRVVIYGDAYGNLGIVGGDTQNTWYKRTLLTTNIQHQINTITVIDENPLRFLVGTVQGSVHCVQDQKEGEELGTKWEYW